MVDLFISLRAGIVQRRVSSASIVEGLDVVEQIGPGLITSAVQAVMDPLTLERSEEALHRCIVIPSADTIHAGSDAREPLFTAEKFWLGG